MANVLLWTQRAITEYDYLIDYLFNEWGIEITERVMNEIGKTIDRIQNSPEQFPVFIKSKNIRRSVASPQTLIFFRVNTDQIEILSVFDNRQDPDKQRL